MRFHFDPYEIFKKTPPPPAKVAKPAKPGGKTGDFSNFSNFSKPIPGFLENPDPSPDDVESTVPGPDIAKLVSTWPKALRMEYAGRVGKYSSTMPLKTAMEKAFTELRDDAEENI